MEINVLTPERELFRGSIVSVKVPGTNGQFQVKRNHAPIVSSLTAGNVELVTDAGRYKIYDEETGSLKQEEAAGQSISFPIASGFVEVLNNNITVLVRSAQQQA